MWLGKFLDIEDDINELRSKIREEIFNNIHKSKLTPLEFTIIESIFSNEQLSGYDLIKNLNIHFAGTWEAQSGTIYPILTKLEKDGFLKAQKIRSPIGPLRKVYSLTEAGGELLKHKVNKNYLDQLKFIENFLIELSAIYIHSFPLKEEKTRIEEIQKILKETLKNVIDTLHFKLAEK
ncbi:MAG: PadR family transcriptional regulator [Promethearchaeota archaeon]|jgi:PadR family transcriptional regulator PadR